MPSTNTNKTSTKNTASSSPKTDKTKALEKKLEESQNKVNELEALIKQFLSTQSQNITNESTNDLDINPNKKTKVTSLTYGYLSLYAPNRSFLRFEKFGDTRILTYAQLVDYVNSCRTSAEMGKFYIHNQDMVKDLGLEETYKNILSDKVFNQILKSEILDEDLLMNITQEQKSTLADVVSQKTYDGEITDIAKIDKISKAINIDILKKVEEMKQTKEFIKK